MKTGTPNLLTRQIGGNLIIAELGRRDYVASLADYEPLVGMLAADQHGCSVPIHFRVGRASWQYDARTFLDIELVGDEQTVHGKKPVRNPNLISIYILLRRDERHEFYIFRLSDLQQLTSELYQSRKRPKNPKSTHCAVWPKHLQEFRDNWSLITNSFNDRNA